MSSPKAGDVILRGSTASGFVVLDAVNERRLAGPVQLSRAIQLARAHGAEAVWQQNIDDRGRPLGPPSRFVLS